jgi:methionyl-tRNA formyltransferase
VFDEKLVTYPGNWHFIDQPHELNRESLEKLRPRYIFFLHWKWKVPESIINKYECICFHMTDVPYGRGGSPLQNLIVRGHRHTKLTALRMVEELDAGPVYVKEDLCLEGNAENIYIQASRLSAQMISFIIENQIEPYPQEGKPTFFKRRTPEQSKITEFQDLQTFYDFIRMLDAKGYPKAFLEYKGVRYEFSRAELYDGKIVADVVITAMERKNYCPF